MLLDASTLRQVFAWQNPFRQEPAVLEAGDVGTKGEAAAAVSVLAANANFPVEMEVRAFCRSAADWPGSPLIIQVSHNALKVIGSGDGNPVVSGARLSRFVIEHALEESGARYVASALDHFKVPAYPGDSGEGSSRAVRVARAGVDDAYEAARGAIGTVSSEDLEAYVVYLSSPAYADFKREFAAVLATLEPAWAMIDTERLPPVLDFALTRDVVDFVRRALGYGEMMLEVEYGATGVSGQDRPYEAVSGEALTRFAEEVACFVAYTGADGIAYPIGMEHGAPTGEKHEPDAERLASVQRRILQVTGRYVPFAQHGGTGAARLIRGLVGKNNVNTRFLVAAANSVADRALADIDRIRAGVKEACGTGLYAAAVEAVREATLEKLKEAGTFGVAPEIDAFLGQ